jgi:bifunctional DNA-binding transcriptional regulator/antitoxin component of YhaV-PrlF toxin-antitoxin module
VTIQRQLLDRVALCSARVSANNYFSVTKKDVESTALEAGDEVRVRLSRTDLDRDLQPRDSDVYDSTLQKSNQVYIPADTRDKLDLETGDIVKYIVVPSKAFPGFKDGPLRNKAKDIVNGGSEEETEDGGTERPERESMSETITGMSMQKTGQVTVPADTMDKMGLLQGDTVFVMIKWQDESLTANKDIGTGNRITINKEERNELGIEPGDEPTMRISVFD